MTQANVLPSDRVAADLWQELVEYDDRTSPEEYPDMALITREELFDFLARHRDASVRELVEAVAGIADDYMTSEHHHPGYVLIPTAKFEELAALASAGAQP